MKSTVIKFLTTRNDNLGNRVRDYLTDNIIDGGLDISMDDYMSLDIGDIDYQEDFLTDDAKYEVYDVTLIGPEDVIHLVEDWENQARESLQ